MTHPKMSGSTAIMESIVGPVESFFGRKDKSASAAARVEVNVKTANHEVVGVEQLESTLRELAQNVIQLDQYPKCLIQVVLHIVTLDGSLLAALCNAMMVLLQRSGILLKRTGTFL